jgi:hypothetical protein
MRNVCASGNRFTGARLGFAQGNLQDEPPALRVTFVNLFYEP